MSACARPGLDRGITYDEDRKPLLPKWTTDRLVSECLSTVQAYLEGLWGMSIHVVCMNKDLNLCYRSLCPWTRRQNTPD